MQTLLQTTKAYSLMKTEKAENRIKHTYLLLLDDARNLRDAMKPFAKILFGCDGEPQTLNAEQQRAAKLIDEERFSDCLFFPEQDKKFSVDDAKKIIEESALRPVEGDLKVFVITDFSEANTASQNKLLKLLEEPPEGVIFLLGATAAHSVLQTVLSRAAQREIPPFSFEEISKCLSRIYGEKYDAETLALCASACGGSLGAAQNIIEGGFFKELKEDAFALALASPSTLPVIIKKAGENKRKKQLLSLLRLIFRDALLCKREAVKTPCPQEKILFRSERAQIEKVANQYDPATLVFAQDCFSEAEKQLFFNAPLAQCLELCFCKIYKRNGE